MPPQIAACVFTAIILALFWLNREKGRVSSAAILVPVIWLFLSSSRSVSQWLQVGQPIDMSAVAQQVAEGNPLDRLVYTGLEVLGLAILLFRWRRVGKFLRANLPFVVFLLFCLLSLLWSGSPDVAFKRWVKALGDFVMVLVVLTDGDRVGAIKRFLAWAGFLLIPLSVLFVKYYPAYGKGYGRWDYRPFYTGVTLNKNTLGAICLLFGLASLWRLLDAWRQARGVQRTRVLLAHGIVLSMVLWLFWMANSMTSLTCFLMAGLVLVVASTRVARRRPVLPQALAAVLVAGAVSVLFIGVGQGVLGAIGRDPTLTDRTSVWAVVIPLTPSPIVGAGFESFWLGPRLDKIWAVFDWQPFEAHNGYIEIYLNLGWAGLALLAAVVAGGYRAIREGYRIEPFTGNFRLSLLVVGLIYNCTEAAFFRMMAPVWILFMLAMVKVPALIAKRQEGSNGNRSLAVPEVAHESEMSTETPSGAVPAFF